VKNPKTCGLDEAGRGALAGPLVAAAIILPCSRATITRRAGFPLRDGKCLNPGQRNKVYTILNNLQADIYIEIISARSINNHGIGWANREIFRRLIKKVEAGRYIVDGNLRLGRIEGKTEKIFSVVDADATIPEVICAGIVAKVMRDRTMQNLHKEFPQFGWNRNAGYGTSRHIKAIRETHVNRYHRVIFVTTALRNKKHT
jgi:ribonuclease HII